MAMSRSKNPLSFHSFSQASDPSRPNLVTFEISMMQQMARFSSWSAQQTSGSLHDQTVQFPQDWMLTTRRGMHIIITPTTGQDPRRARSSNFVYKTQRTSLDSFKLSLSTLVVQDSCRALSEFLPINLE